MRTIRCCKVDSGIGFITLLDCACAKTHLELLHVALSSSQLCKTSQVTWQQSMLARALGTAEGCQLAIFVAKRTRLTTCCALQGPQGEPCLGLAMAL